MTTQTAPPICSTCKKASVHYDLANVVPCRLCDACCLAAAVSPCLLPSEPVSVADLPSPVKLADETLETLSIKFAEVWALGAQWRLDAGELLYKIKARCAYSQWGEFLDQYDMPRSTADDWVRRWKNETGFTEPRLQDTKDPAPLPDQEADRRNALIDEEKKKRVGRKRTPNLTTLQVRLPYPSAEQRELYLAAC